MHPTETANELFKAEKNMIVVAHTQPSHRPIVLSKCNLINIKAIVDATDIDRISILDWR